MMKDKNFFMLIMSTLAIWILSVLTIALLSSCSPAPIYINQTIEKEVIKECAICQCPEIICNYDCPDCICTETECKTTIKTVKTDDCTKKLDFCNIRLDFMTDEVFRLDSLNSSGYLDELRHNLSVCLNELENTKDALKDLLR